MKEKLNNGLYAIMAVLTIAMMSFGFEACSGDDDEGSASLSAGVLDKDSGLRLKKVGSYSFFFNDNGQLDYLTDGSNIKYDFSYNPDKIVYSSQNKEEYVISVSYNKFGYITSVSTTSNNKDGFSLKSNSSCFYDGNGHIVSSSAYGEESETQAGTTYNARWTTNGTCTWKDDLLVRVEYTENYETDDGYTETTTETWTFTYDEDLNNNPLCQWAPSFEKYLGSFEIAIAYVGLMGTGPRALPTSAKHHSDNYYNGKSHTTDESYTYRYGFNTDGSISYAYVNNSRYNFSYDYAKTEEVETRSTEPEDLAMSPIGKQIGCILHFFSHHHINHHPDSGK